MPNVAAGATGTYTFTGSQVVTFTLDPNESATFSVRRSGVLVASDLITSDRSIGPFLSADVLTVTSVRGGVDYTISEGPGPSSLTAAQVGAVQGEVALSAAVSANLNDITKAAANRAILQSALDGAGNVNLRVAGVIFIDDAIVIRSRTHLRLGSATRIKLYRPSDVQPKPLLITSAVQRMRANAYNACTFAWTAGKTLTITRAAHGLSAGNFIFSWSLTLAPSTFAGVFPIISITDADTFVVRLHRVPTAAPTGTAQYMLADESITVEGGIWDMDYPTRTAFGSDPLERYGLMMCGVAHLTVRDTEIAACPKYLIYSGALWDYNFSNVTCFGTGSDGIKIYGPATKGAVTDFTGEVSDDGVSAQTKEPAAFLAYMLFWGDIDGLTVMNTGVHSVANAVVVFPTADQYMGGITIDGVDGSTGTGSAGVTVNSGQANAVLDDITIRGVRATALYGLAVRANGQNGMRIRKLKYVDCPGNVEEYGVAKRALFVDLNIASIDNLTIEDMVTNPLYGGASFFYCDINSPVGQLNVRGGTVEFANALGTFLVLASTVQNVNVTGLRVAPNCATVFRHTGTGSPNVTFTGCDFNQTGGACWSTNAAVTVNLNGNRINVGSQGVVRSNTTPSINKINSGGNEWVTTNVFSNGSTTGLWQFRGWDIPLNLNATGVQKTIPGQFAFNTTLAGTLAANRLAICNGTSWLQSDNLANVF